MNAESITPELIQEWTRQQLRITDYTLGDIDLSPNCPLDNGRHAIQPMQPLGHLSTLPLEVLTNVLLRLDILSLTDFRLVNQSAMQMVDSIPQYQLVYRHCPQILRSIISTEARHFDFRTLHDALCKPKCVTCGDFGGYLYLITCLRVCYICFTGNSRFLPVNGKQASMITGCPRKELKQLPHIRSIRGRYAGGGRLCRERRALWDREAVLSIQSTSSSLEKSDRRCNDPRRFMAIVPAPYFELPSKVAKWGLYCLGCSESHEEETYFRKQYTKQGFVDHIAL
ncbi:hypothetical protein VTK56DRAFT_7835 [Thermocarpiscus australiensis]